MAAIAPVAGRPIVEIGPGKGALTIPLLNAGSDVHVVEIDRDLAGLLRQQFGDRERFHLHEGDALQFDFRRLAVEDDRLRIVGNLPYNISTPLLFHLLDQRDAIADMHFMLQKEVVDRMAAGPGNRDFGRLSVMCQYHASVAPLFVVPPEAFNPAPRVFSAVVRIVPRAEPLLDRPAERCLSDLVAQAFTRRRKALRNALDGMLSTDAIDAAGVDPGLRPEAVDLAGWMALARFMAENGTR